MNILVIPDTHLKTWIFDKAENVIAKFNTDKIVILGDLVDDWDASIDKYESMMERCIQFAKTYPDAIWLWGNHDVSYLEKRCAGCSGHFAPADAILPSYYSRLENLTTGFKFVYYEDGVFFSHGGISAAWIRDFPGKINDYEAIANWINSDTFSVEWSDISPIWYRPSDIIPPFHNATIIQIAGHTPAKRIAKWKNVIYTDTFSTYLDNGKPIGTQDFLLFDTETKDGLCINAFTLEATKLRD